MSTTYIPTQHRINDPYQQRIFQYNNQDSRVYLSRTSNYLLKAFGNNAYIKGFDILSYNMNGSFFEVTIDQGILIQDTTLIEVTEQTILTINVYGFDECNGYLIVYPDYQYIESISQNQFSLKLAYITWDGLIISRDETSTFWNANRNQFYISMFQFFKGVPYTALERNFSEFYVVGKKYFRLGGELNFVRTEDPYPPIQPFVYQLPHNYDSDDSYKIVTQLTSINDEVYPFKDLQLEVGDLKISIDEYRPITNNYYYFLSNPDDAEVFAINSISIPTSGASSGLYILEHNIGKQYLIAEVYDANGKVVTPRYINFTDINTVTIDFSNFLQDLSDSYKIVLIKENILVFPITIDSTSSIELEVMHYANRQFLITHLIDSVDNKYINSNNSLITLTNNNVLTIDTDICNIVNGDYHLVVYNGNGTTYKLSEYIWELQYHIFIKRLNSDLGVDTFRIKHNFEDILPAAGMIEESDSTISYPDEIQVIDENNVDFSFSEEVDEIDCIGFIYSYDRNNVFSLSELPSGVCTDGFCTYTLDVTDFNYMSPVFQIYNSENKQISATSIVETVENCVYEFTFDETLVISGIKILAIKGYKTYSETFTTGVDLAPVLINHNLESEYLLAQLFEVGYSYPLVIHPFNFQVSDENNIYVQTDDLLPSSNYKINIVTGILKATNYIKYDNFYYKEFTDSDLTSNSILINHGLNFICPHVQVFDEDNIKINSGVTIQIVDFNNIRLTFSGDVEIEPNYKVSIITTPTTTNSL